MKTVYPICIAPTIEINYDNNGENGIQDVTINSTGGSSGTSGSLFVGKRATYGISRTLMRFPELSLSAIPTAACITSATVEIRDLMCEADAMTVYCYVYIGGSWSESTATWSSVSPSSYSMLLSSNSVSYSNGVSKTTKHRYSFDITAAVTGWKLGNFLQSNGIIFKASSSVENGSTNISKTFASYNRSSNKPSLMVNYTTANSQSIADGTYGINNMYYGKYIGGTLNVQSGKVGTLGSSIYWKIQKVYNGYVIRYSGNTSNYLAVPMGTTGSTVELFSISNVSIPSWCVWDIIPSGNGGYYIKNTHNSRYLYFNGTSLSTVASTGTYGSGVQKSCVWRLATSNDLNSRELLAEGQSKFGPCDLVLGYSESILQFRRIDPHNALWTELSDFVYYESYDKNVISFDSSTGIITPKAVGETVIRIIHKPTGNEYAMDVKVWENPTYLGRLSTWNNCENSRVARWNSGIKVYQQDIGSVSNPYFAEACSTAYSQWSSALDISISKVSSGSSADIEWYTASYDDLLEKNIVLGNGMVGITKYNSQELELIGYYLYNNSAKFLFDMVPSTIYVLYTPGKSLERYKNTCTHELGHALGYMGHSASSADIMYYLDKNAYTLTNNEKEHLIQVYD